MLSSLGSTPVPIIRPVTRERQNFTAPSVADRARSRRAGRQRASHRRSRTRAPGTDETMVETNKADLLKDGRPKYQGQEIVEGPPTEGVKDPVADHRHLPSRRRIVTEHDR
jgi:hypothetical protein